MAETSTYTSFGELSRSGGVAGNGYAYTGREWEPELGRRQAYQLFEELLRVDAKPYESLASNANRVSKKRDTRDKGT